MPTSVKTNSTQPRPIRFADVATEKLSKGVFSDLDESLGFVMKKFIQIVIEGQDDEVIKDNRMSGVEQSSIYPEEIKDDNGMFNNIES